MDRSFRPFDLDQTLLLPPSLRDWLPDGHLAYFILDVIEELDLSGVLATYGGPTRGNAPYDPKMMTGLLLYAYAVGVPSSRRIAKRLEEDVSFRVVSGNQQPDFRTICEFRRRHAGALRGLFVQVLRLCERAGMVKLGHVALDGTKIKANASKEKTLRYKRMDKEEAWLQKEVGRLLEEAEEADKTEDELHGEDRRGDELPKELATRQNRLKKLREVKEAMEREARERDEAIQKRRSVIFPNGNRHCKPLTFKPDPERQYNFTDPDSRIMPTTGKSAYAQAYNAQAVVDDGAQVIVAQEVSNQTTDAAHTVPMAQQVQENLGAAPREVTADSAYFNEENVVALEAMGTSPHIPPVDMNPLAAVYVPKGWNRRPYPVDPNGNITAQMRWKLLTKEGRRVYAKRQGTVEPVFGQIKQARGFRQFLLRGLEKVRIEWSLICTTHNLLKLWRAGGRGVFAPPGTAPAAAAG